MEEGEGGGGEEFVHKRSCCPLSTQHAQNRPKSWFDQSLALLTSLSTAAASEEELIDKKT